MLSSEEGDRGQGQPSIEASRSNKAREGTCGGFQRGSRKVEAVHGRAGSFLAKTGEGADI